MNEASKTLAQMKKANKLSRLAFRKMGPKSYKRGQGALMNALLEKDNATQRELVEILGCDRGTLKDIVKKASRNAYVTIGDHKDKHTYTVALTEEGKKLAQKRAEANDKAAEEILSCLSDEEVEQLNALTEKVILSLKEKGISGKKKGRKVYRRHAGRPHPKCHHEHHGHYACHGHHKHHHDYCHC